MSTIKSRRVFQLRKTSTARPKPEESEKEREQKIETQTINNNSYVSNLSIQRQQMMNNSQISRKTQNRLVEQPKAQEKLWIPLVDGPELVINTNELFFKEKTNTIQVKNLEVKNIGSSSIYFELIFKNKPKISPSAIKDPKPKFFCHYEPSVIQPGHALIFSFSFLSEMPGVFIQECQIVCRPETKSKILPIKLKGEAFIKDHFLDKRREFKLLLAQRAQQKFLKEVVDDIVHDVRSPDPPLPDVKDPGIAQNLFQTRNWSRGLFYNKKVHKWFDELFHEVYAQINPNQNPDNAYWDQSIETLKILIQKVQDEVLKESFFIRLDHYSYLSSTPPKATNKSDLFESIRGYLLDTGYKVGGDLTDEAKKQLQMWQIPFEQPKQDQTEEQLKAKIDENTKIKAEWAKKMKKKKWGEQEEREIVNEYKSKATQKIKLQLENKFQGFSEKAQLIKANKKMTQEIDFKEYFRFLERLKSVHEYKIEGKKIFLKFSLKLRENPEQKLKQLAEYLVKKKQEEQRLEEEKKNQNNKKKKQSLAKKKKGQKEEEEIKPVFFDFQSLLDVESWNGLMETLKLIIEKQPFLLVIGCSHGPRKGIEDPNFSVKFLLEHIRKTEPAVEYLSHTELFQLNEKLQEQQINEGSIYLTQNLNFLSCQVMQKQVSVQLESATEEKEAVIIKKIQPLLMSQIRGELQRIEPSFDLIISEERSGYISGLTTYTKCDKIVGSFNWKYLAISQRVQESTITLGGDLTPQRLIALARLMNFTKKIYLTGKIGAKFFIAENKKQLSILNVSVTEAEKQAIKKLLTELEEKGKRQNLVIPGDFMVLSQNEEQTSYEKYQNETNYSESSQLYDIGKETCDQIVKGMKTEDGQTHFFLIKRSQIDFKPDLKIQTSFTTLCREIYQKQEQKREKNMKLGSNSISNYENQLIFYLVGFKEEEVESIELVPKKVEKNEENEDMEEEPEENDEENENKKIDLLSDFKIADSDALEKLILCQFDPSLKDMSRYPKSD